MGSKSDAAQQQLVVSRELGEHQEVRIGESAVEAEAEQLAQLSAKYGLEMQPDSIPGLLERFDLVIGEPMETVLQLA